MDLIFLPSAHTQQTSFGNPPLVEFWTAWLLALFLGVDLPTSFFAGCPAGLSAAFLLPTFTGRIKNVQGRAEPLGSAPKFCKKSVSWAAQIPFKTH